MRIDAASAQANNSVVTVSLPSAVWLGHAAARPLARDHALRIVLVGNMFMRVIVAHAD